MDEDLIKCSKCKMECLKSNFYRDKKRKEGLQPRCLFCRKNYYKEYLDKNIKYCLENQDRIKQNYFENGDKIIALKKIYYNKKVKTDNNFRLIENTRKRIDKSLKGLIKKSSTKKF